MKERMMSSQQVSYNKEDRVAIISIDGPPRNRLEVDHLYGALSGFCSDLRSDKEIRVVVLTGSREDSFSMGEGLFEGVLEDDVDTSTEFWAVAEHLARIKRPTIASTPGDVIGQGLELALACDIRIASKTSHFGFPHVKRGLIPWDGGTQRLSRTVGKAKAMEMILTGEVIDAEEASQIGLINRVVSPPELTGFVSDMARDMASKGPVSLEYVKEAIDKGMDLTLEQGLRLEADLYFLLHTTGDRTEGIRAFKEKRAARFEGK
ncbi:MAG: enoyl-CoA hydratase-related protein [Desulfatiglandales bacterium]|nr:enoyl-CoA hydratase-related protein [Desulfatiglandales bacterium]